VRLSFEQEKVYDTREKKESELDRVTYRRRMRRNGVKSHLAKKEKSRRTSENGIREIR